MTVATTTTCLWLALLGTISAGSESLQPKRKPPEYVVVVNAKNPFAKTGAAARTTVKQLFLKDLTQWPTGKLAKPYARRAASKEQVAFQKTLLGMKDAELARHWLRIKNMNGLTPPKAVGSDRLLLKFIERHEGAFGIVRRSAVKGNSKVRVLFKL